MKNGKKLKGKVSAEDYVIALTERMSYMTDEQLGYFVKQTIWTVTGDKK